MKTPRSNSAATPLSMDWPRDAGLADQFLAQVESKLKRKKAQRRKAGATGISAALIIFAFWLVPVLKHTDSLSTPAGQRGTLALEDGSQLEMNARTELKTDFRYGRRHIKFSQGEAFFSVAKDTEHPFVVETPQGEVRVTGTKFNVRLGVNQQLEVTLMEGGVNVTSQGLSEQKLSPNQQFDSRSGSIKTLSTTEVDNALLWRSGQLALDGLTLTQAAERLASFHGKIISVTTDVAALRPGGTYPVDDLFGFFEALETALPVRVQSKPDGSFEVVRR